MTLEERLNELAQGLGRRFAEERDRVREIHGRDQGRFQAQVSAALLRARASGWRQIKHAEPGPPGPPGEFLPPEAWKARRPLPQRARPLRRLDLVRAPRYGRAAAARGLGAGGARRQVMAPTAAPARRAASTIEGENYQKLDRVSFNGSEWIARRDDPGPLPGDGWMLGAQKARGKPGPARRRHRDDHRSKDCRLRSGTDQRQDRSPLDLRAMFERYDRGARRMSHSITSSRLHDAADGAAAAGQAALPRRFPDDDDRDHRISAMGDRLLPSSSADWRIFGATSPGRRAAGRPRAINARCSRCRPSR